MDYVSMVLNSSALRGASPTLTLSDTCHQQMLVKYLAMASVTHQLKT
jgi:hypothetical protein